MNQSNESPDSRRPQNQALTIAANERDKSTSECGQIQQQTTAIVEKPATGPNSEFSPSLRGDIEDDECDKDVDGGYAWIILVVMFVINASTFGTARAYGLIFDKLARVDEQTRGQAALPFTVMGAIENMAGPLSGCLLAHTTISWRLTVFTGSCLVTLAHLFAALSPVDCVTGQLLSMGWMCGLGLSFVSISFFQLNNAYFVRYRSTAFGVGMTGAAFGALYISPICQYALDHYENTRMCYFILAAIIAPNVPLSLLLKPKSSFVLLTATNREEVEDGGNEQSRASLQGVKQAIGLWASLKLVVAQPIFHLIWPTQLLFCWFNFVFGMIIVDFGKDRGLETQVAAHLVPVWAIGQLVGRLVLSALVDLKFLSCRALTIICFGAIGLTVYILNNSKLSLAETIITNHTQQGQFIFSLVFVLSMFIALIYILLNGLVASNFEEPLQPLSIGLSSFLGSFFLLPRAYVIGHYRDTNGNYDSMLSMFTFVSLGAASIWLIMPTTCEYLIKIRTKTQLNTCRIH